MKCVFSVKWWGFFFARFNISVRSANARELLMSASGYILELNFMGPYGPCPTNNRGHWPKLGGRKKSTNVPTFNIFCTVHCEPMETILNPKLNTLKSSKLLNN